MKKTTFNLLLTTYENFKGIEVEGYKLQRNKDVYDVAIVDTSKYPQLAKTQKKKWWLCYFICMDYYVLLKDYDTLKECLEHAEEGSYTASSYLANNKPVLEDLVKKCMKLEGMIKGEL